MKKNDLAEEAQDDDMRGIGEIDEIVGFHIRLAHSAVRRHFTETFSHLKLTQKQVSVLWLVGDHPGIAQTDLCQRLRMDRATVMAIVNRLEERKLLKRGVSKEDRRRQTLTLRAKGEDILADAKYSIREHENWLKSLFTEKEVKLFMKMLKRIHG